MDVDKGVTSFASLDRLITERYGTALAPPRRLPLLYGPHRRAVDQLAAIRLDAATIFELVHSALSFRQRLPRQGLPSPRSASVSRPGRGASSESWRSRRRCTTSSYSVSAPGSQVY